MLLFMGLHMELKSLMMLGLQMQINNTLYNQNPPPFATIRLVHVIAQKK
jgi:hypothetical protein